jgi:phage-related protein (TIGR01555 family)
MLMTKENKTNLQERMSVIDGIRSTKSMIAIDGEEDYKLLSTGFGGVRDIIDRIGLDLCAAHGIPEQIFFGRSQGGLNSSGQRELEHWYSQCANYQQSFLLPVIDRIVNINMRALNIYTEDYLIKFNPLYMPSAKDQAETDETIVKTLSTLYDTGIFTTQDLQAILAEKTGWEGTATGPQTPDDDTEPS